MFSDPAVVFGILSVLLARLSYQDWKEKLIDVPTTLFASGFVFAAYAFSGRYWEILFWGCFFFLAMNVLKARCEKNNLLGAGDVSVLSFLSPAAWFANAYLLSIFFFLIGFLTIVFYRGSLLDKKEKAFIPIITVAWVFSWIIWVVFLKA